MTSKKLLLVSTLFAGAAFAQAPIGTVTNVQGVVTATQGAAGMTVAPGTAIQNGTRFITTSNGSVTLQMNSGCTVTVPPAHGVSVFQNMTCQQLAQAVQPVTTTTTTTTTTVLGQAGDEAAFGPTPDLINGVIALGALGVLAAAVHTHNENAPLSPQ